MNLINWNYVYRIFFTFKLKIMSTLLRKLFLTFIIAHSVILIGQGQTWTPTGNGDPETQNCTTDCWYPFSYVDGYEINVKCKYSVYSGSTNSILKDKYFTNQSLPTIDKKVNYLEFLPADYDNTIIPEKKYPVIIATNWQGRTVYNNSANCLGYVRGSSNLAKSLNANTLNNSTFPFITILPLQPNGYVDTPAGEYQFLDDVISFIKNYYTKADLNKIYILGESGGGGLIINYISSSLTRSNNITAAITLSSASYGSNICNTIGQSQLPLLMLTNNTCDEGSSGGVYRNLLSTSNCTYPNPSLLINYDVQNNPTLCDTTPYICKSDNKKLTCHYLKRFHSYLNNNPIDLSRAC